METQITEIAPNIYRLSTYVADSDLMYNQFLVVDDEPVLFQTGLRKLFPLVLDAVGAPDPGRTTALDHLWAPQGRRVWVDEPMAGRVPKRAGRAWSPGVPDFSE